MENCYTYLETTRNYEYIFVSLQILLSHLRGLPSGIYIPRLYGRLACLPPVECASLKQLLSIIRMTGKYAIEDWWGGKEELRGVLNLGNYRYSRTAGGKYSSGMCPTYRSRGRATIEWQMVSSNHIYVHIYIMFESPVLTLPNITGIDSPFIFKLQYGIY